MENNTNDEQARIEKKNEKKSLTEFIEQNHKLISVLGILTALTVFTYNLPLKLLGYLLSFGFLFLTILVWFELWAKFPKKPTSWRLSNFESTLQFLIFGLVIYWFLAYREIWHYLLVFPLWLVSVYLITWPILKYKLFKDEKKKSRMSNFLRYLVGVLVVFFAFLFLDGLQENLLLQ